MVSHRRRWLRSSGGHWGTNPRRTRCADFMGQPAAVIVIAYPSLPSIKWSFVSIGGSVKGHTYTVTEQKIFSAIR
jgi:hypothetical protein